RINAMPGIAATNDYFKYFGIGKCAIDLITQTSGWGARWLEETGPHFLCFLQDNRTETLRS
ncbi:MAG: hypothetical protein O3C21_13740, partial [Verrucomicrobia bacterium]|nr:hypothetical protein [Verrucomicrobiota bacterium]